MPGKRNPTQPPFILAKEIWKAADDDRPNQYAAFRTDFVLDEIPEALMLFIRADNRYAIWINGRYLPAQQYSDYDFWRVYDRLPVQGTHLVKGLNSLAVLAYCQNEDSSTYRKGRPGLIFELRDEERVLAASGLNTKCSEVTGFEEGGEVEKVSEQLSYSFRYDATVTGDWTAAGFNDAQWTYARVIVSRTDIVFHKRPVEQCAVGERLPAVILSQGAYLRHTQDGLFHAASGLRMQRDFLSHDSECIKVPNEAYPVSLPSVDGIPLCARQGDGLFFLVDLGRESVGYVCLDLLLDASCDIDVGWGEHLDDLRVRSRIGDRNFAFSYRASSGKNSFFYPIKRIGARYLEVHIASRSATVYYVGLLPVCYPLPPAIIPVGLNGLQTRIYKTAVHTLQCCMHEHYEDTPWREQALYAMDGRNEMLFTFDAFGASGKDFAQSCLWLLALGLRQDGLLELCAPAKVAQEWTIPSFSLIWVISVYEYLSNTRDVSFAGTIKPVMDRVLQCFALRAQEGLIANFEGYWNFYEWREGLDGTGKSNGTLCYDAPLNAFYAMALDAAEAIYTLLEDETQAFIMRNRRETLIPLYREAFFNADTGDFRLGNDIHAFTLKPQLVQALSLLAGMCPDNGTKHALTHRLLSGCFQPECTLSHRLFVYQAMLPYESLREAVLTDTDARWGAMLQAGATSFWETEAAETEFGGGASRCHGWSAAPIYVYHRLLKNNAG